MYGRRSSSRRVRRLFPDDARFARVAISFLSFWRHAQRAAPQGEAQRFVEAQAARGEWLPSSVEVRLTRLAEEVSRGALR